jgi:hypothetical protein
MKNNHLIYPLFAIVTIAALGLNACKKEKCQDPTNPKCENYDPCFGKKTINTFFRVRPGSNGFKPPGAWCDLVPCDTFNASSVRFDIPFGNPENSTYEWQIGTEATPRTGKAFEVDFSDYRQSKGYVDLWIPVTLTIRTPLNACLTNPEDTLVTVTRELFFTKTQLTIFEPGDTLVKYKGYFTNKPNEELVIQHIKILRGRFRKQYPPIFISVGVPFTDTLFRPSICYGESCGNYIHTKSIVFTDLNHCNEEFDYNISESETIFLKGREKIKQTWLIKNKSGHLKYEFIGERIE